MFNVSFGRKICLPCLVLSLAFCVCSCKSMPWISASASGAGLANSLSVAEAPKWVLSPNSVYNSSLYITNVGTGRDRDAAQTNALSGLAAVFGQNVNTVTTSTEVVSQVNATYEHNRLVEQNIQREVNQNEMLGVSVDNFWFDGNFTWYAIAVMDRMNAASLYESRIKDNSTEISKLVDFAKKESGRDPMAAYARYNSAASLAADNDVYITRLHVLNSLSGEDMRKVSMSGVTIRNNMYELIKNILVSVKISGDSDGTIKSACAQVFAAHGFATAATGGVASKPRYELDAAYQKNSASNSANTIVYCRYSLVGYLTDTVSGERLMPVSVSGREGAANQEEAERRALSSLKKNVAENFYKQLTEYLENLH